MEERASGWWVGAIGVAVVVAFFLPFIDIGLVAVSGWEMLTANHGSLEMRIALGLLPIAGLGLIVSALAGPKAARFAGAAFGIGVFGYTALALVRAFFATSGYGLWITLAAAVAGLAAPLVIRRR